MTIEPFEEINKKKEFFKFIHLIAGEYPIIGKGVVLLNKIFSDIEKVKEENREEIHNEIYALRERIQKLNPMDIVQAFADSIEEDEVFAEWVEEEYNHYAKTGEMSYNEASNEMVMKFMSKLGFGEDGD